MNKGLAFWVVIPAAGRGARMASDEPKQYASLDNKTVIEHSLDCFLNHPQIQSVVVCVAENDTFWQRLPVSQNPLVQTAFGGAERSDTVICGLKHLLEQGVDEQDWVLVHDAARPNLSRVDLDKLLHIVKDERDGGLLASPCRDTLKKSNAQGYIEKTLDRTLVWHALTPQMFRLGPLLLALSEAAAAEIPLTDEASAMEWAGFNPRLVEGRLDNIKITFAEDLLWLKQIKGFA